MPQPDAPRVDPATPPEPPGEQPVIRRRSRSIAVSPDGPSAPAQPRESAPRPRKADAQPRRDPSPQPRQDAGPQPRQAPRPSAAGGDGARKPRAELPPRRRIRPRLDRPVGGDPAAPPRLRPNAADQPPASGRPRTSTRAPGDARDSSRRPPSTRPRLDRDPAGRDAPRRPRPSPQSQPRDPNRRRDDPDVPRRRAPRADSSWLDEVQTPRRPVRRTDSEPVDPAHRNARPAERRLDDWTTPPRASGDGPRRGSERPPAAQRRLAPARAGSRRPRPAAARRLALPGGVSLPASISLPLPDFRGAHARRLRLLGPLLVLAAIAIGIAALVGAFSSGRHHVKLPTLPAIPARSIETQHGPPATVSLNTTFGGANVPGGKLSSLELDLARGFHFDPRAAVECAAAQAQTGACPSDSAIGSGTGEIVVQGPYLPQTAYDVSAAVYLTPPTHRGDIAGLALDLTQAQSQLHAVILGRVVPLLTTSYAVVLRFADASRALSTNYDLNLRRLALTLQASRTVSAHTYHLLTNPTPCTRPGWPLQLSITSAKRAWIYHGAAACRGPSGTSS